MSCTCSLQIFTVLLCVVFLAQDNKMRSSKLPLQITSVYSWLYFSTTILFPRILFHHNHSKAAHVYLFLRGFTNSWIYILVITTHWRCLAVALVKRSHDPQPHKVRQQKLNEPCLCGYLLTDLKPVRANRPPRRRNLYSEATVKCS